MSKLPKEYKFLDLSDYGRPPARWIANCFKKNCYQPCTYYYGFFSCWYYCYCLSSLRVNMLAQRQFFSVIKSILDAADGELARVKRTPSYVGRYLDSVADIILNFFIFTFNLLHLRRVLGY